MISAWTIRTEVEKNGPRGEGILERPPLAKSSLSGRTIWLALTTLSLFVLYIADRFINLNETSKDATEGDDLSGRSSANPSSTDRSSTNPGSSSTGCSADSEAALLWQLFPDGRENGTFFSDEFSRSSKLLGERFVSSASRRSRTSASSSITGDIELASRAPSRTPRTSRNRRGTQKRSSKLK